MKNFHSFRRGAFGLAFAGLAVAAIASEASFAWHDDHEDEVKEERKLEGFTKVRVKGAVELYLVAGKAQKVSVETAADRLENVETYVRGDTLIIDMSNGKGRHFWRDADVNVSISMPSLEAIEVSGAVDAEVSGVDSDSLKIDIKGAGDLDIEGKCKTLVIDVRGAGDIDAEGLKCENVELDIRGAGSATVFASNEIDADVAGVASISVYGKPKTVHKHMGGFGSISIH